MPFIMSKVNIPLTAAQRVELTEGLGKAIEHVPGKSEASLMVGLEEQCHLYLRGEGERPMAYITVAVFDNPSHRGYVDLSRAIASLFAKVLDMDPAQIYVNYEDIPAWSVAGRTFSLSSGGQP